MALIDDLLARPLEPGCHNQPEDGACVIEWLRLHEQLEFNDQRPDCQSPAIHRFLIKINDRCPDEIRDELKPIALLSLGTADKTKEPDRAYRLADVACREWAPQALEARGQTEWARKMRALRPVRTKATAARAKTECRAAYAAAADASVAASVAAAAADDAAADAVHVAAAAAAADAAASAAAVSAADAAAASAAADAVHVAADVAADAADAAASAAADAAVSAAVSAAAAAVWRRAIEVARELCVG